MVDKDDGLGLGLSLSLGGGSGGGNGGENGRNPPPPPAFPFKFMPSMQQNHHHRQPPVVNKPASFLANAFHSSTVRNGPSELQSMYLGGIDVNQPPVVAATRVVDVGEEAMVSSPNSTVSSVSGKKSIEREDIIIDAAERGGSMSSQEEDDGGDAAAAARKKLRLSKEQAAFLEETFKEHNTLNPKQKVALAKQLNLRPRQVEVWFQNRRARTKLKQTEVDCEYLKRCCENLTDENRRLQKEVNELRALKLSPQFYMNMSPPTTLTMCPQCERVAVSSSTTSSVSAAIASGSGGGGGGGADGAGARQQPNIQPSSGSKQKNDVNPWAAIFPNQNQK